MIELVILAAPYLTWFDYELGTAHVLFTYNCIEGKGPKNKRKKPSSPALESLLDPLVVISRTPGIE